MQWACLVNSLGCIKAIVRSSPEAADVLCLEAARGQSLLHLAVIENHVTVRRACMQFHCIALSH